jgi:hypothetical protein
MSAGPNKLLQRRNGLKFKLCTCLPVTVQVSVLTEAALEPGPDREPAGLRRVYWGVTGS